MQGVRGNVAYGQFVWPACRRSLSRLTQSRARQIGIDGEHRPFRIIPALSVTKRASTNDFTLDPVGSAVLFVSIPMTRLLHILHLSSGTHFFIPLRSEVPLKKKVPSMQLNSRWRGPWQHIIDWMECFYAVRISQARARLPLRPAIKWKMNGRGKTLVVVISLRREPLFSGFPHYWQSSVLSRIKHYDFY